MLRLSYMLYSFSSYAGKVRLALALLNKICRFKKKNLPIELNFHAIFGTMESEIKFEE